jgi:uncharacterized protein (TIGR00255 family)
MALSSMTGFARSEGAHAALHWQWELRSVNGRGLDIRLRLPAGLDALDPLLRERLRQAFSRGSISCALQVEREAGPALPRLNEAALEAVLAMLERIHVRAGLERGDAVSLLGVRGVLDNAQPSEEVSEEDRAVLMAGFDTALQGLLSARQAEGARLRAVLEGTLAEVERLGREAEANPARTPEAIRQRLAEQVARILGTDEAAAFDPVRLHQEAALLAAKADVREELDRLAVHVSAARELLASSQAVGRKLDFLSQELNREANTLCSKSNDVRLTAIGLALKAAVDQFREQVQNIE